MFFTSQYVPQEVHTCIYPEIEKKTLDKEIAVPRKKKKIEKENTIYIHFCLDGLSFS